MKKTIITMIAGLLLVPVIAFSPMAQLAGAAGAPGTITDGATAAQGDGQTGELFGDTGIFKIITNTALYIIGAISVLMLIFGGIRYTISGGDSAAVTSAKNTIMYAIIGIIVALLAYAIVNFVLGTLIAS
jgi:hypothetical protein